MKPFHGGGWVNVHRIADPEGLEAAYDASGRELMHLQAGVDPGFLTPQLGNEIVTFGLSVGAFFRWEFNSFEVIGRAFPPREHEQFVAHYRGLLAAWANDSGRRQRGSAGRSQPRSPATPAVGASRNTGLMPRQPARAAQPVTRSGERA